MSVDEMSVDEVS